jgi:predicted GIY-YIG superfamily endonuclease
MSFYYVNPKIDYKKEDDNILVNREQYAEILNDVRLSAKAKGMMSICFCFDKKYFTTHDFIVNELDKIDSITSGIKELIKYEYVLEKEMNANEGCVYILSDNYGNYKIGFAIDLAKRLRAYNTHSPHEPSIIKTIQSTDMRGTEKFLHDKFKAKHIRNEWYKLDTEDIEYIKSL